MNRKSRMNYLTRDRSQAGQAGAQCLLTPPPGDLLPWLRQTGILAGFDAMLDLTGSSGAFFEAELAPHRDKLFHHFAMSVARKP